MFAMGKNPFTKDRGSNYGITSWLQPSYLSFRAEVTNSLHQ